MKDPRTEPSRDPAAWRGHLGKKVTLRYRLHDDVHPFSEAVGMVASVGSGSGPDSVEIVDRRGTSSTIVLDDIVAAKVFD